MAIYLKFKQNDPRIFKYILHRSIDLNNAATWRPNKKTILKMFRNEENSSYVKYDIL